MEGNNSMQILPVEAVTTAMTAMMLSERLTTLVRKGTTSQSPSHEAILKLKRYVLISSSVHLYLFSRKYCRWLPSVPV